MDVVIAPAGTRVHTWRLPHGWPLLSFTSFTGQLVVVRVDHLSPGVARWFAATLSQAADAFAREVDACFAEGEPGWERRTWDGRPDLSGAVPVPLGDPAGVPGVHAVAHQPPPVAASLAGENGRWDGEGTGPS
ncbi:hypothetical protein ABZ897_20200 [Nonomuraea sp. NPDC046802]|uniref:hypothetical protein n=1 Tax=Nonomuraea sp. NPDC046802 TaxID=3154919 RepID=UPI0033D04707